MSRERPASTATLGRRRSLLKRFDEILSFRPNRRPSSLVQDPATAPSPASASPQPLAGSQPPEFPRITPWNQHFPEPVTQPCFGALTPHRRNYSLIDGRLCTMELSQDTINPQIQSRLCQLPDEIFKLIVNRASPVDAICVSLTCKALYSHACRSLEVGNDRQRNALLKQLSRHSKTWQACSGCSILHKLAPRTIDYSTDYNPTKSHLFCNRRGEAKLCRRHKQTVSFWQKQLLLRAAQFDVIPQQEDALPISVLEHDCDDFSCDEAIPDFEHEDCPISLKTSAGVRRGFLILKTNYTIRASREWLTDLPPYETPQTIHDAAWKETHQLDALNLIECCGQLRAQWRFICFWVLTDIHPAQIDVGPKLATWRDAYYPQCWKLHRCKKCSTELQVTMGKASSEGCEFKMTIWRNLGNRDTLLGPIPDWSGPFRKWNKATGDRCLSKETRKNGPFPEHQTLKDLFEVRESLRFQADINIVDF